MHNPIFSTLQVRGARQVFWIVSFLTALGPSFGQTIEWTRQFGTTGTDYGFAVATAPNAIYAAGSAVNGSFPGSTPGGRIDAFVARLALDGTVVWARQFGTSEDDAVAGAAADAGGVYVVGYTDGGLQGANAGGADAFVRKYDPDGNVLWTRQFGGSGAADDQANAVAADSTGLYVAGSVTGSLPGQAGGSGANLDAFVRKYDAGGGEGWTRQFGTVNGERGYGVAVHAGGVYVAGETGGDLATSVGGTDYFVRKLDANGATVWTRQFGTSTNDGAGYGGGVAANSSGVYVTGVTAGTFPGQSKVGGLFDAFVQKLNLDGNPLWVRQFGTSGDDFGYGAALDTGWVYVTGQANSGVFLWRFDLDGADTGNLQRGTFATVGYGVATDASGAYVAGATSALQLGQEPVGDQDVFVFKVPHPPLLSGVAEAFNGQVGSAQSTWTALYGSNLAKPVRTWDGAIVGTQLPLSLDGVAVSINGKPAPIYFISPNQVNVLAPLDDFTGDVQVTLNNVNGASRALVIRKAQVLPAFYAPFADGNKLMVTAVALDGTLVGKRGIDPRVGRGGRSGEIVQFFATGFGKTNPSVPADRLFAGVPEVVTPPRVPSAARKPSSWAREISSRRDSTSST